MLGIEELSPFNFFFIHVAFVLKFRPWRLFLLEKSWASTWIPIQRFPMKQLALFLQIMAEGVSDVLLWMWVLYCCLQLVQKFILRSGRTRSLEIISLSLYSTHAFWILPSLLAFPPLYPVHNSLFVSRDWSFSDSRVALTCDCHKHVWLFWFWISSH